MCVLLMYSFTSFTSWLNESKLWLNYIVFLAIEIEYFLKDKIK